MPSQQDDDDSLPWLLVICKNVRQLNLCGSSQFVENHLKKIFSQSQPLWSSWVFFVSQMGKCQHWPKPLTCPKPSRHVFTSPVEKIPWLWGVPRYLVDTFEGGNLLNLNLTPVTKNPENPATSRAVWLSCRPTSVRFIILFLRELCQFAFVCVQHNMHNMCTHKKKQT